MAQAGSSRGNRANGQVLHEVKKGRVKAAIWENESRNGVFHKVTFQCLYRKDGAWKSTQSFSPDDLRNVVAAAVLAEEWLDAQQDERTQTPEAAEA